MAKITSVKHVARGSIIIDRERCKGCTYCVAACPQKAIAIDTKFNGTGCFPALFTGGRHCTGCAVCAVVCPEIAIEVWKEE